MSEINKFNQTIGDIVPNWKSCEYPSKNKMTGKYCSLEILDIEKHASDLFDAISFENKGESWTYLSSGPIFLLEGFQQWLHNKVKNDDTILYVIIDLKSKKPIGIAGYLRIDPTHGTIEVGHLHYSKFLKQTPLATEAMYLMMHYVFEELHYRRYEWKCNSLNEASRNAALRLGFQFEGIFRQCNVFKNHNRDTTWFSILDNEWPALKIKFEKWLDENNFDLNGKQIKRLQDC
ncbi:MAG TPA: GNAT family protein [Coxiellaceae bacterium]|nr:MAG: GNAT family N-acetyltransferase [Gammaproteobacteria bacterium RIFCSPHIGHO2_12_FULL_36_30]HLB56432.1 GNAT family protein [Coxiellaceae bacterium]